MSDATGARAVGVLSPGREFGTSKLTVRIEDSKESNTIFYVENYGSPSTGRYRYGLQETLYDPSGTGDKVNVGGLISNGSLRNSTQTMRRWSDAAARRSAWAFRA